MRLVAPQFRIKVAILILLVMPLIGLVTMSVLSGQRSLRDVGAATRVGTLVALMPAIAAFVTELQKERGSSVGFIGARGQRLADQKQAARQAVDALLPAFRRAIVDGGLARPGSDVSTRLATIDRGLSGLAEVREAVDRLARPAQQVATHYTAVIEAIIDLVEASAEGVEDAEISTAIAALSGMMRGREAAGLERAMGSNGFGAGRFEPPILLRFVELQALQDGHFGDVRRRLPTARRVAFDRVFSGDAGREVVELRRVGRESAFGSGRMDIPAERWWQATTRRLEQLIAVEAGMIEELIATAQRHRDGAKTQLIVLSGFAFVLCVGTLVAGLRIVGGIVGPLRSLTDDMTRLARRETALALASIDRRDEIGDMTRAVGVFRDSEMDRLRLERDKAAADAAEAERQRMMQDLVAQAARVVAAAARGDFAGRIERDFSDGELQALREALNRLVRTVDAGLGDAIRVLDAVEHGDLTQRITSAYEGAFARLRSGGNSAVDRLSELIGAIREAVSELNGAAREIVAGSDDLARRTTQQAAMVEEAAAALEEFGSSVASNAQRATRVAGVTHSAELRAAEGGRVMRAAREAMGRIDGAAGKISEVVGLIENIAFQTNLIALNASVEAARAGEAGRGFAVVAGEVRRLAQHASNASGEVKALIGESVGEVRSGVSLVEQASTALDAIVDAISEASGLMTEIADVSEEQSSAVADIASTVRHLDEITQQNAALVEETNSAIRVTEQQVGGLESMVTAFKIATPARDARWAA
jgi:methyl-accepting chemotaxis protein